MINRYFIAGCFLWGMVGVVLYCLRPKSQIHDISFQIDGNKKRWILIFTIAVTVCMCTVPMNLSPIWNGKIPDHRNQYELMAESILDGHFYMDYDVDPILQKLDNPYDPKAREEAGAVFQWDHAYYQGHYYMYFGVVPVFLVFLPYRIIMGTSLTTYHATQFFVVIFICGIYVLFYKISSLFFRKITFGMYLMLSTAFSMMSIWYSADAPALYCTAITAGLCLEIWSMIFFIHAVFGRLKEKRSIFFAFLGSLTGALAFGCRPPVALANILVFPLLGVYIRDKPLNKKRLEKLAIAALPYLIVAVLLMAYNYARFGDVFEFGASYQLTVADQSHYGGIFSNFDAVKIWNGILSAFISYRPLSKEFPYISHSGALINFPILWFSVIGLSNKEIWNSLKKQRILYFVGTLFFLPLLIVAEDSLWAPGIAERYRMDIYWIMGILCFLVIGSYGSKVVAGKDKRMFSFLISMLAVAVIGKCFLLFLVPADGNVTEYFPDVLVQIQKCLTFGK